MASHKLRAVRLGHPCRDHAPCANVRDKKNARMAMDASTSSLAPTLGIAAIARCCSRTRRSIYAAELFSTVVDRKPIQLSAGSRTNEKQFFPMALAPYSARSELAINFSADVPSCG
jgi:hypothetical protein